jgi:hypothetical protein
MDRQTGRGLAALTAAAVLGWGLVDRARAEPSADAERADSDTAGLIRDAVAEYDAGRFEEARALFRSAHARSPTARTLRGIGMSSFELRDYVDATRALEQALHETRRPLTEQQRRQVETLLARAETFIGRFTPRVEPATATLMVDGEPAHIEADGSVLLPFGRHRITARCPSCTPVEKLVDLEVTGGERGPLDLALAPAEPERNGPGETTERVSVPGAAADRSSPALLDKAAPAPPRSARRSLAVWLGSGGVLALIGAGVGALWWRDRQHELDTCQNAVAVGERCPTESTIDTQRDAAAGVTLGLGAGALTLGTIAAVLWSRRDVEPSRTVACWTGIGSVSCEMQF